MPIRLTTKQALLLMAGLAVMIGAGVPKAQAYPSDVTVQTPAPDSASLNDESVGYDGRQPETGGGSERLPSDQQLQLNYRHPDKDRIYFASSFQFAGLRADAWHSVEDAASFTFYEKDRVGEIKKHETLTFIAGDEKGECRFFEGTHAGLASSESGAKGNIGYSGYCYRTPGPGAPCHCGKTVWCRDQPCPNEPYRCWGPYGSYSDQDLYVAGRKACGCD